MFKNSVFTNPAGWAARIVGTKRRYITVSALTALAGCFIILLVSFRITAVWKLLLVVPPVFIVTIELPLYCLRALRDLQEQKNEGCRKGRLIPRRPSGNNFSGP